MSSNTVFALTIKGLSQFLQRTFIPLLFLVIAGGVYVLQPHLIFESYKQFQWLPIIALSISCVIAWQFGRSRLVCLGLLLLTISLPLNTTWLLNIKLNTAHFCLLLMVLAWLMLGKDKGFSLYNTIISMLILSVLAATSIWLIPLLNSYFSIQNGIISPSTRWLFFLWPKVHQWFSASEIGLILLTLSITIYSSIKCLSNSQIALSFSWLSIILLRVYHTNELTFLFATILAVIICYAVIKDSFAMAFKDELTGIPSRRALMQMIDTMSRKYTVVMCDIDHFKQFNDIYGHDVGDEVLKLVATKLSAVTGGGKAFRFGGEEFVILFPGKNSSQVIEHIDAIRLVIANYGIALRAKPRPAKKTTSKIQKTTKQKTVKVTCSFGVAEKTKAYSDFTSIMKQADIALYAAKKSGRNCTKEAKQ